MSAHRLTQLMESFEQHLGSPQKPHSLFHYEQILKDDEQEQLSWPQIQKLMRWGFMEHLIPRHLGGQMDSLESVYCLIKLLARRDITTAIAIGLPLLPALPMWLFGNQEQQERFAYHLQQGDIAALALTEEEHGTDLVANELYAQATHQGWELSGSKWCINFATYSQIMLVLCRTHQRGGLLGFSLFLLDKSQLGSGFIPMPKLPTHGVRGLDISGFTLDKASATAKDLLGVEGKGLEFIAKAMQLSRILLAGIALGGADNALRNALGFSLQRQVYGKRAFDIPAVKQRLGEQFTQLLIAECVSWVVIRAGTLQQDQLSLWSAVVKYLIPKMAEDIVEQSALVVGARAYLRTTSWAMLQKIRRDIPIIGLFDGSSQVNLSIIAGHLVPQVRMRGSASEERLAQLPSLFCIDNPAPAFDSNQLSLFNAEEDSIMAGFAHVRHDAIASLLHQIMQERLKLDHQVMDLAEQKLFDPRGLAAFELSERYCWLFAASCCVQFWQYNPTLDLMEQSPWIHSALQWILKKLNNHTPIDRQLQEVMADKACVLYEQNKLFSVLPCSLAE